ncbi:MAG TPA: glycosyltransferase [Chitinophagaceae bacterium]|nr:glycosyltransferase [Chitinophagaceae bacterium]
MFRHFLITRFNLRTAEWETTKHNERVLDDAWYENRFDLFEKFCLPSVVQQTNQNFSWIILFDTQTPDRYKTRIDELVMGHSNFMVLFIDGMKEMGNAFSNIVRSTIDPATDFVVSTRLDNDDMIHRDFIKIIQQLVSHAPEKERLIIDLRSGLQLNLESHPCEVRKIKASFNPFISVAAPAGDDESVVTRTHSQWSTEKNVIVYDTRPLWVEIVHSKNKVNAVKTKIKKGYGFDEAAFGVGTKLSMENYFRIFISNTKLFWQQFFTMLKGLLITAASKLKSKYKSTVV